ncbi:MAG TPA: uroporphyrinogen decarboxylase family protein [Candidatus Scatomonas merdavium]|nr:uroporphyrinogen decarboxylase family protein [Candidatus Scatomonas merdavium]
MNMDNWMERVIYGPKKPFPLLSYPCVQYLYVTVKELVCSSTYQAMGMKMIADNFDMLASTAYMDLSVEAEAFGAFTVYGADEVPTIIGKLISTEEEADALQVPEVGAGRTGTCIEAIHKAMTVINDRPVFAGCIGPFSLAGRLLNVNDIMVDCYEEPEMVHKVLEKATAFIISYLKELKKAGAHGAIMAEPLAGILSPDLMSEFSSTYVRKIVEAVQDKYFLLIYHNCGSAINHQVEQLMETGCKAFHFGESADMPMMLEKLPKDYLVLGNISPSNGFNNKTPEELNLMTRRLLEQCGTHKNFVVSSGCDVPPNTDMDNINEFFKTVEAFYYRQHLWDMLG